MAKTLRHTLFSFLLPMLLPLFARGQEPLSYAETIQTASGCSDSIFHEILVWGIDRLKEDNRNEVVVHNFFGNKGILLLKFYQDFRTTGAVKDITDKITNVPIVGKKVKSITDYTNLGLDGFISCFVTIEVEDGRVTVKQERFFHTANAGQGTASQGLICTDEPAETTTDLIGNKSQYKAMQATALPLCKEWWEQTTATLKARIQQ